MEERTRRQIPSGLAAGFASGLLTGILLVGGPSLYRATWVRPEPAQVTSAPVLIEARPAEVAEAPAEAPEAARKQLDVVTIQGKPGKAKDERPLKKPETPAPKANPRREERHGLSDEELAKLARFDDKGAPPVTFHLEPEESSKPKPHSSLSQADFMAVVRRKRAELTGCYERALLAASGQQNGPIKISVLVTVSPSGKVRSVETQGDGLPGLVDCLEQTPKRWAFARSDGESAFNFPLLFQPGGR